MLALQLKTGDTDYQLEEKARPQFRWTSIAFLLVGIAVLVAMQILFFRMTVDDAYISFRYSKHLAEGLGLVWNVGEDPVEGYTNFAWVVVGTGIILLGLDIVLSAKILGMLLGIASVVVTFSIARRIAGAGSGAVPALLLGASPALALWSVSGLETALFVFLLLVGLWQFLREEPAGLKTPQNSWYPSSFVFLLLSLTRPEGIVVFGALVIVRMLLWIRQGTDPRRILAYVGWTTLFGIVWLIYFVWRWTYFGYPFPNTAYVKAETGLVSVAGHVAVYLIPYLLRVFPFVVAGIYALGQSRFGDRAELYVGVAAMCFMFTSLISSDWMPGHRLLLATTPLFLLLSSRPLASLLAGVRNGHWSQRVAYAAVLLALVCYMVAPLLYTANAYHRVMATQMDMSLYRWAVEMESIVEGQYVEVGQWLAEHAPPRSTVFAGNVGAIAYLSDLVVIDQIGLNHEYIARNGWTVDYVLDLEPDFIVIESDTADAFGGLYGTGGEHFAASPEFIEQYELLFVLDNGRTDELALFIHHLPHATWLYARKELGLAAGG